MYALRDMSDQLFDYLRFLLGLLLALASPLVHGFRVLLGLVPEHLGLGEEDLLADGAGRLRGEVQVLDVRANVRLAFEHLVAVGARCPIAQPGEVGHGAAVPVGAVAIGIVFDALSVFAVDAFDWNQEKRTVTMREKQARPKQTTFTRVMQTADGNADAGQELLQRLKGGAMLLYKVGC
jgi:hypothetical protein